jgi:polysaccharide pyruvyl transferase WcaK-like protein
MKNTLLNERIVKILIAEWIPSLNKGELAILVGMLETFKILGKTKVSIFSIYPSIDKERYPENLNIIDVISDLHLEESLLEKTRSIRVKASLSAALQHLFFTLLYLILGRYVLKIMNKKIWREYYESDVIIICHNGVNCIGGCVLDFSPIYITLLAKILHKPVIIYANGTDDFGRGIRGLLAKLLAVFVLNNADLITTRDDESFLYLQKFVLNKARIYFTGDPAILLPSSNLERVKHIMHEENIDKNKILIGVALSHEVLCKAFPLFKNEIMRYEKAITEIALLLDNLIEKFGAIIVFIPHCIEPYWQRDDRVLAKDIYNLMKNKHNVRLINKEYSPQELKGILGQLDLLVSTRVHAAISALSMGTPSIILKHLMDKRADRLVGKNLNQEKWIYDIGNLNFDDLFNHVNNLLAVSNEVRKNLPSIIISAKKKALLNGILLKTFLIPYLKKQGRYLS